MNNYIKTLMILLIALTATAFSCSQRDEAGSEMGAAAEDAADTVESGANDTMNEVGSLDYDAADAMAGADEEAGTLVEDMSAAASAAMAGADGEVGSIADEAKDMAKEAMDNVEGMSEEELLEKAKEEADKKLGIDY